MEATKKAHPLLWIAQYLRESKIELEKVAWPSRQDTIRYTTLVIGASVGLAAVIAGIDWFLAFGLEKIVTMGT